MPQRRTGSAVTIGPMSSGLSLMADPRATYRRLSDSPTPTAARVLLRGPLLLCLVLGVSVSLGATGRLSVEGVLSAGLTWSFAPAVQLAALAVVMKSTRTAVPLTRATDLFFLGHLPWSLWMLAVSGAAALTFPAGIAGWPAAVRDAATLSALLPLAVTARITSAFCREVLALPAGAARRATALYLTLVWGFVIAYAAWTTQLWPRMLAL